MPEKINNISSAAVKKATSRTWDQWIALLDRLGAKKMVHRDIARMINSRKYIKSGWWCQMVTNSYEKARGQLVLGQTADAGFQIEVTKTLPISPRRAWQRLISPRGIQVWLGRGRIFLQRGKPYRMANGVSGELRTVHRGRRLRLTYQPRGAMSASTLQINVVPRQSIRGTCIGFHYEKLRSAKERESMRRHWQQVLRQIEQRWG